MNFDGVDPRMRGALAQKWRTLLGWSVAEMAKVIEATPRTVSNIESGAQPISNQRWALFVKRLGFEIANHMPEELVVVVTEAQVPVDVVSRDNFAGLVIDDEGYRGLIASYCVDRVTGIPKLHRQPFLIRENKVVVEKALRWEAEIDATVSSSAEMIERWMRRRALRGELANPQLTELKVAVNKATQALKDLPPDAPDEDRARLAREVDTSIARLMAEAAKNVG